ncbi:allatostatin-A receptor-like [Lytechinus variegatus]|uniref:allatostatin-A receptor-like n=1 Tax=Lytechinus variegatus TaxID=7654 RepID=UPI001BB1070B|nr:allatostatin-A receptor-like [Lytechinus variegatus]
MANLKGMLLRGCTLMCLLFSFFVGSLADVQTSTSTLHHHISTSRVLPPNTSFDDSHLTDAENRESTVYDYSTFTTVMDEVTVHAADNTDVSIESWAWYPMTWPWHSILRLNSAIIGIIGNAVVILVVFNRRVSKNSTDILIGSLAVADLLSSIAIVPVPQIKYVPSTWLGEVYCRVVNGQIFMWFFVTASIFTLTAISVERYVAVIHPFTFRRIFSIRRTTIYIIIIWTICVINYATYFYFFIKVHEPTHSCQVPKDPPSFRLLGGLSQVIFKYMCPLFIMVITQAMIIITLHRQAKRFRSMNDSKVKTTHAEKSHHAKGRVIRMLLLVVITFMVCWSPSQMSFLLYSAQIIGPAYLYSPLNRIFTVMGFYNSCANPIIYTISNAEFRLAVKSVLTRKGSDTISAFGIKSETDNPDTAMSSVHDT